MKIKLLRVFVFAFACVMGTSGVSVWADDVCESGQYLDISENICKDCPLRDYIGNEGTRLLNGHIVQYDYNLYSFDQTGQGITSCKIKLDTDKSKCDTGTNVVYIYNENNYNMDRSNYTVVPDSGYAKLYTADNATSVAFGKDHCGKCASGEYIDDNTKTCVACPRPATTNCGQSDQNCSDSVNNRFNFTTRYNDDDGITGCAVELKPVVDNCDSSTEVIYVYDSNKGKYIRKELQVFPGATSLVVAKFPPEDDMVTPYCTSCPEAKPYSMNGECSACDGKGVYLETIVESCIIMAFGTPPKCSKKCKTCPAGSMCPGNGEISTCPVNTYAEEGSDRCTDCPIGYFTDENNNNGLCEAGGKGCVSSTACKFKMSKLCINGNSSSCFTLDEKKVNVESVNRSVVKEINQ